MSASITEARVATENASKYLQQLCKHWSHKFDVTFDPQHGVVPFGEATCTFDAEPHALRMRLECPAEKMEHMEQVVVNHLQRFAFREELTVTWARAA